MPSLSLRIKNKIFYGWVIVISLVVIGAMLYGVRQSYGVFFKSIESEFDISRTLTSGVFSAFSIFYCVFTILAGWALDRYGPKFVTFAMGFFTGSSLLLTSQTNSPWQLFISYSLLLAVGMSAVYNVVMTTTSRWFDKKRGIALGIASSGAGLGPVAIAPFATYLIFNFDWRTAYIVVGSLAGLVAISLSMLLKKEPGEIGALPDGVKPEPGETMVQDKREEPQPVSFSLRQAFGTTSFWFFTAYLFVHGICLNLVFTHLVPHATDVGISAARAAVILSLMGGFSISGRLLTGWTSDKIGRKVSVIISALLHTGALIGLVCSQELWMFYLFAVFFGFSWGGLVTSTFALIGDVFGLRSLGIITGVMNNGYGLGSAIGPLMGGFIFDISKDYSMAFLATAIAMLIATLLLALTKRERA